MLARVTLARMSLTVAVQTKGFGARFRSSMYAVIACTSWPTLWTARRLSWRCVSSEKKRSTRFSHEDEVGTK